MARGRCQLLLEPGTGRAAGKVDRHRDAAAIEQLDSAVDAARIEVRVDIDYTALGFGRRRGRGSLIAVAVAGGGAGDERQGDGGAPPKTGDR